MEFINTGETGLSYDYNTTGITGIDCINFGRGPTGIGESTGLSYDYNTTGITGIDCINFGRGPTGISNPSTNTNVNYLSIHPV